MNPNINSEFVTKFCAAWGAKQVGVIRHGGGINPRAFAEEEEIRGLIPVELTDHTRLYKFEGK